VSGDQVKPYFFLKSGGYDAEPCELDSNPGCFLSYQTFNSNQDIFPVDEVNMLVSDEKKMYQTWQIF